MLTCSTDLDILYCLVRVTQSRLFILMITFKWYEDEVFEPTVLCTCTVQKNLKQGQMVLEVEVDISTRSSRSRSTLLIKIFITTIYYYYDNNYFLAS